MRPIKDFEEFRINECSVTTDLSSAQYHPDSDTITIQGTAIEGGEKRQIEIVVQQGESIDFSTDLEESVSIDEDNLDFSAGIIRMIDKDSGKTLYHV